MKTKYLKIKGNPIDVGQEYFTVNHFGYPHKINTHTADSENNTVNTHYFLDINDAIECAKILDAIVTTQDTLDSLKKVSQKYWNGTFVIRIGG